MSLTLCQHLAWRLSGSLPNANLEEQRLGKELLGRGHLSLVLPSHSIPLLFGTRSHSLHLRK